MDRQLKIKTIIDIALQLDADFNTAETTDFFSNFGIKFPFVSKVDVKRLNVIDILSHESNSTISRIADELNISVAHPNRKVFISHSSKDALIVEQMIELLEAIGVPSDKIFCTSFDGYGVALGADFLETIKNELSTEVLVLFTLSSHFYTSPISLCEMGATWARTSEHIPILIPPFDYADILGVIPTTQGMKINDKGKLNSLKQIVEKFLSLDSKDFSQWERKRDNILKNIESILERELDSKSNGGNSRDHTTSVYDILQTDNFEEKLNVIRELSERQWPDDFEMQVDFIERQKAAMKALAGHNPPGIPKEVFERIRSKAQSEWPDNFEMQLENELRQVESFMKLRNM